MGHCFNHSEFRPVEIKDKQGQFSLKARVLGIVYSDAIATHPIYFKFPLLDSFCLKLEEEKVNLNRIIILLTDQEAIFDTAERSKPHSPYWKDTCTLQPILEHYFKERFDIEVESAILAPQNNKGLDDWNVTLKLVQVQFATLGIDKDDDVIVSHQAGTPAISSAVQFGSLSRFGSKVSFLTSNESNEVASLDPSSSYFEAMQIQEAQKLLQNYNYLGVESVLNSRQETADRDVARNILALLEVAKLWNLSKFADFKDKMQNLEIDSLRDMATERFGDSWSWWIAYEEAYLGIIRRRQGNIVEAFFHSFRAFEGIFAEWGKKIFKKENIVTIKDIPCIEKDILKGDCQKYLAGSDLKSLREELSKEDVLYLELMTLCKIFKKNRSDYKPTKCPDITIFWDNDEKKRISARRNFIFHQVQGITEEQLLGFWLVDNVSEWQNKILRFLNFIADEKDFKTWEEASLMARVHKQLEKEIASLEK